MNGNDRFRCHGCVRHWSLFAWEDVIDFISRCIIWRKLCPASPEPFSEVRVHDVEFGWLGETRHSSAVSFLPPSLKLFRSFSYSLFCIEVAKDYLVGWLFSSDFFECIIKSFNFLVAWCRSRNVDWDYFRCGLSIDAHNEHVEQQCVQSHTSSLQCIRSVLSHQSGSFPVFGKVCSTSLFATTGRRLVLRPSKQLQLITKFRLLLSALRHFHFYKCLQIHSQCLSSYRKLSWRQQSIRRDELASCKSNRVIHC